MKSLRRLGKMKDGGGELEAVALFGHEHTLARTREQHKEQLLQQTSLSPRRKRGRKKKKASASRLREREAALAQAGYSMTEAEYNYDFAVPVYEREIPKYDANVYIPNRRLDSQRQPESEGSRARRRRRAAAEAAAETASSVAQEGGTSDKAVEVCRLELMKRVVVREGYLDRLRSSVTKWARPAENPLARREMNATVLHLLGHIRLSSLAVVSSMQDWVNASVLSSAAAATTASADAEADAVDVAVASPDVPRPIFMFKGRSYSGKVLHDLDFLTKFPRMGRLLQTPMEDLVGNPLMLPRPRPASPRSPPRSRAGSPSALTRRPGSSEAPPRKVAMIVPTIASNLAEAEAFLRSDAERARAARPPSPLKSPKNASPSGKRAGRLPAARGAKKATSTADGGDASGSATARKTPTRGSGKRQSLKSPAGKKLAAEAKKRRARARKQAAAASLRDTATDFEFFETDTGKSRMQRLMPLYNELSGLAGLNVGTKNAMLSYTAPDSPVIDQLFPGKGGKGVKHHRRRRTTRSPSRSPPRTPSTIYGRKVPTLQEIAELARLRAPPHAVPVVMEAVCILLGEKAQRGIIRGQRKPDFWPVSTALLKDGQKLRPRLMTFDHSTVSEETIKRVTAIFAAHPDLKPGSDPGKAVCRPIGKFYDWVLLVMELELARRHATGAAEAEAAAGACVCFAWRSLFFASPLARPHV